MKAIRRTLFLLVTVLAFAQAVLGQSLPTFGWMRAGQNMADRTYDPGGLGAFATAWSPDSSLVAIATHSGNVTSGWVNLYRSSDGMLLAQFQELDGCPSIGAISVAFLPGNSLAGHPENLLVVNDYGGAVLPTDSSRVQVFSTSSYALLSTNYSSTIFNNQPTGLNTFTLQVNASGDSVLINGNIYSTSTVLSNQNVVMNGIINGGTVACLATELSPPNDHQCLAYLNVPSDDRWSYCDYSNNALNLLYTWPVGGTGAGPISLSGLTGIYIGATWLSNASWGYSASSFLPLTGGPSWSLPFTFPNDLVDDATFAPNGNAIGLIAPGSGPGAAYGMQPIAWNWNGNNWDATLGTPWFLQDAGIEQVKASPDSTRMLVCSYDMLYQIANMADGSVNTLLNWTGVSTPGPSEGEGFAATSADGTLLATTNGSDPIRIWNVDTGALVSTIGPGQWEACTASFYGDNELVVGYESAPSGGYNIAAYDLVDGTVIWSDQSAGWSDQAVNSISIQTLANTPASPGPLLSNSLGVAMQGTNLIMFNPDDGHMTQPPISLGSSVTVYLSPDLQSVALSNPPCVLNLASQNVQYLPRGSAGPGYGTTLSWSPDSKYLVISGEFASSGGPSELVSVSPSGLTESPIGATGSNTFAAFSPYSDKILNYVVNTSTDVQSVTQYSGNLQILGIDGSLLATISNWNPPGMAYVEYGYLNTLLTFTPSELYIAFGQQDGTVGTIVNPLWVPPVLSSVTVSPSSVTGATSATATVTLAAAAVAGGATVTLTSSNPAVAELVASSVTLPEGWWQGHLTINTSPVTTPTQVTITATYQYPGQPLGTQTTTFTVNPPAVSSFTVSPSTVTGGASVRGTATLNGPAPAGGAVIKFSSNNSNAIPPSQNTVPAGGTIASFNIATLAVTSSQAATLTATYGGGSATAQLTINPPLPTVSSFTVSPSTVVGGTSTRGTATLSGPAPTGGAVVKFSSNSSSATPPSQNTVPAGGATASFNIATASVSTSVTATLTATYNNSSANAQLTVTPQLPNLISFTVSPTTVVGGTSSRGTATLGGAALTGGAVIKFTSNNPAATPPGQNTIPAGGTTASFNITTSTVTSNVTATISATYNGTTLTAPLTITPPLPTLISFTLSPSTVVGGVSCRGIATLSFGAPVGGAVIKFTSNNPNAIPPSQNTVPAGGTSANFSISTLSVASTQTATLTASYNNTTANATLTINP